MLTARRIIGSTASFSVKGFHGASVARILFVVPPLVGHLNPALATAWALEREGHEIAWAADVSRIGARLPEGAQVYPLDDATAAAALSDDAPAVRRLESVSLFWEYALPLAERLVAPLEAAVQAFAPQVMVVDHQMLAGALVARRLGLPWVTLVTTSASILKTSPGVNAWIAEQYLSLQRRHLPPEAVVENPDFSPYRVIVFSVESIVGEVRARVEAPYAFVGPARAQGRRDVEFPWAWLRDDARKVLITLGTISRDHGTRFFEVMIEAMRELPQVQAVMVAPASLRPIAPDNVLIRDYVPQAELLRKVDAVICHAGHNTVCEALSEGLPLVVAPIRDDQPIVARQVIDAGAGLHMRYGKVTPATARARIERVLDDPGLALAARRLAETLRQAPGAEGAAQLIAELAAPADVGAMVGKAG